MIVVIEAGCAECHGWATEPLITAHEFETVDAAKEWANDQQWLRAPQHPPITWTEHPLGGEHVVVGQGSVWITPLVTPSPGGLFS